MKKLLVLSLLLIGISPPRLAAQEFTGTIVGVVSDDSGGVMPGVSVTVSGAAIQGTRSAVSESNGTYRLTLLPPGTYTLVFKLEGFATLTMEGILVGVGRTSTINTPLKLATLSEGVIVTGETPVVDLQSTTRGVNFDQKLLETLPIGSRNLGGVLTTMPGIQVTAYDVGGSNMGTNTGFRTYGLSGQWNVRVDGTTTQDTASNLNLYLDYGALSEMQVSAAINSAESNVPGAAVNMTVKSGSNQLHSQTLYQWEGKSLQSNNLTPELQQQGIVVVDNFNDYHDFNVNAGGPISKDKLWWFYSFRDQAIHLHTQLQDENQVPGALFTTSIQNHTLKSNYTINPTNTFFFTGMTSRKKTDVNGRGTQAAFYDINSTTYQWTLTYIWRTQYNRTLGNHATFQASVSTEDYDAPYRIHPGSNPTTRTTDLGAVPLVRGSALPFRDSSRKYQYEPGVLNYFTASHNIKTSYGVIWVDRRSIHHAEPTSPGQVEGVALFTTNGAPTQFSISNNPHNFQSSMWQNYFFVQDKWQVAKKVVANLGLRWDRYLSMYPEQGNDGIGAWSMVFPPTHYEERTLPVFNNWVPRLGVIYDILGNGKTALKANYGRYAEDPDITFAQSANPNSTDVVNRYTWNGTLPITPDVVAKSTLLSTTGQFVPVVIDPKVHNQYTDQILLGVDHQLMKNFALTGNWVRVLRYQTRVTYNLAQPTSGYAPVAAIDPGRDGVVGTGDDRPWTVYERTVPAGTNNYLTNANTGEYYDTIELSATKRFANGDQFIAGWDRTVRHLGDSTNNDPNTRQFNGDNRAVTNQWDWKMLGTYVLPWEMQLSGSLSVQEGEARVRTVNFTPALLVNHPAALAQGSTTVTVEPSGSSHLPNVYQSTLRLEKRFNTWGKGHTFTALLELYNVQNANTIIGMNNATGVTKDNTGATVPTFGRGTQALNPRIARIGVRYNF